MTIIARVYLVRHGETDYNKQHIFQGHLDVPLNAEGLAQSETTASALESVPFCDAYSSDLCRAARTAEIILLHHPNVQLHREKELRERFLGARQGHPVAHAATIKDSGEAVTLFAARLIGWWDAFVARLKGQAHASSNLADPATTLSSNAQPRDVLLVFHGGCIQKLMQELVRSGRAVRGEGVPPPPPSYGNCSVTVLDVEETGAATVVKSADCSHLAHVLQCDDSFTLVDA